MTINQQKAIDDYCKLISATDEEYKKIREMLTKKWISLPTIILKDMGKL